MDSFTSSSGCKSDEVSQRLRQTRLAFFNYRHLRRRQHNHLLIKGAVYTSTVEVILLCGRETRKLRVKDIRTLSCLMSVVFKILVLHVKEIANRSTEVRVKVLGSRIQLMR